MEANELRIGNLIKLTDTGEIITVTGIMQDSHGVKVFGITSDGTYCNPWIENCEPIPITEDWLVKFGWGKGEYDTEWCDNVSLKNECLCYNVDAKVFTIETGYSNIYLNHIHYVHQLQNLYFALTGSELEINY